MRYSGGAPWRNVSSCAPVAQGIERLPPEQKAAGSNPAGAQGLISLTHGYNNVIGATREGGRIVGFVVSLSNSSGKNQGAPRAALLATRCAECTFRVVSFA